MPRRFRGRSLALLLATVLAAGAGAPAAHGQEVPDVRQLLDDATSRAQQQVDAQVAQVAQVAQRVGALGEPEGFDVPGTNPEPLGLQPGDNADPDYVDPNYVWASDPASKVLAGKPFADEVLHRVPGSYHDAPRIPAESDAAKEQGASLYGPGTPVYVGGSMCTVAVAGYDEAGRKIALTAGHCGEPGTPVASADSPQLGVSGTVVSTNPDLDYSVIELGSNTEVSRSYNGVTVNSLGGEPAAPGDVVCKEGVASGRTCGMTFYDYGRDNISQVCAMYGDSGAPLVAGDRVVGLVTGGVLPPGGNVPCYSPLQGALHTPTLSTRMDTVLTDMDGRSEPGRGFRLP